MKAERVTCIKNEGFSVSLRLGNSYDVLPEEKGAKYGLIRVIDETGEDYLYPASYFVSGEAVEAVDNGRSGLHV